MEDRLMLSGVNLALVHDLAEVEPVREEMRQRPHAEPDAAAHAAIESGNSLGPNAASLRRKAVSVSKTLSMSQSTISWGCGAGG
jgi:hypothetical protein